MFKVVAPAKLNLTFEIGALRSDGFHDIASIFHSVDLFDELSINVKPAREFKVLIEAEGEQPDDFPLDESNLIAKAARAICGAIENLNLELHIKVNKKIPIAAGLAGGSADAAATLVAVNQFFGTPLTQFQLLQLAAALGADVPFCMVGGTALGTSKGEVLQQIPETETLNIFLVKPHGISISTPWAYKTYDKSVGNASVSDSRSERIAEILQRNRNWSGCFDLMGNDFERMIFDHHSQLVSAKEFLLAEGVKACHLTGKGPTLYAIADGAAHSSALLTNFKNKFDSQFACWTTRSIGHGAKALEGSKS